MIQNVDLADDVPMFITVGDCEIAVLDANALRVLQDKAARYDALTEKVVQRARLSR